MGAWIETTGRELVVDMPRRSHPVWVRGLKLYMAGYSFGQQGVAPRVGAWIETVLGFNYHEQYLVAPRVGAWIETHRK